MTTHATGTPAEHARGLDAFNDQRLDRAPRGRGEDGLRPPHDEYAPVR